MISNKLLNIITFLVILYIIFVRFSSQTPSYDDINDESKEYHSYSSGGRNAIISINLDKKYSEYNLFEKILYYKYRDRIEKFKKNFGTDKIAEQNDAEYKKLEDVWRAANKKDIK